MLFHSAVSGDVHRDRGGQGTHTIQWVVIGRTYNLAYDAENHMTGVSGAASASFVYNGEGQRVIATVGGDTTVFIGNYFEWHMSTDQSTKYYYADTTRIAMRTDARNQKSRSRFIGVPSIVNPKQAVQIAGFRHPGEGIL